jgi:hypothetical protein
MLFNQEQPLPEAPLIETAELFEDEIQELSFEDDLYEMKSKNNRRWCDTIRAS